MAKIVYHQEIELPVFLADIVSKIARCLNAINTLQTQAAYPDSYKSMVLNNYQEAIEQANELLRLLSEARDKYANVR